MLIRDLINVHRKFITWPDVAIPFEEDMYTESIKKVEDVHDKHLEEMRSHFMSRIHRLESKLEKSQKNLKQKESILDKFRGELKVETTNLSRSLVDLLNSSRNGHIEEHEAFHQEVVCELEKQLNQMRADCLKETEEVKTQCNKDLEAQKHKYETYLKEIKECYQLEREVLEERIRKFQDELDRHRERRVPSIDSSFQSDFSRELGFSQLAEQLIDITTKYSDLKIKSSKDLATLKDKKNKLAVELNEAKEQCESWKNKFDELTNSSKEEIHKLKVKVRVLDKGKREAEEKLKEIGELRRQVTMLKTDMVKSEATEKKLKDAIKKKKEELAKEKKLRKQTSSNTLANTSKTREVNNKLEKDIRSLLGDNTKLKEENKILRNRVSELVSNKDMNPAYYRTGHPTSKLNSSLSVPLSIQNPTFSSNLYESNLKDRNEKRREFLTRKSCDKFPEYRATSYKVLPTLAELTNKDKKRPSSKGSCRSLSKSSFFFGDKKRSDSREKIIGDIETGSCKYCEVCKYRVWRKKLLTYDALDLLNNRDLIKSITCLACDKNYDVRFFINHCKDCRLTNGVPPFRDERGKSIIKTDFFS